MERNHDPDIVSPGRAADAPQGRERDKTAPAEMLDSDRLARALHRDGKGTCMNWEPGYGPSEHEAEMAAHRREAEEIVTAYEDATDEAMLAAARERRGDRPLDSYQLLDRAGPVMSSGLSMAQPNPTERSLVDELERVRLLSSSDNAHDGLAPPTEETVLRQFVFNLICDFIEARGEALIQSMPAWLGEPDSAVDQWLEGAPATVKAS